MLSFVIPVDYIYRNQQNKYEQRHLLIIKAIMGKHPYEILSCLLKQLGLSNGSVDWHNWKTGQIDKI